MFQQDWHSSLHDSSRYDCYRTFKSLLQPEKYLSVLYSKDLRNIFIKFRLGLLDLMVNEGRKMHIEKTKRLCPMCKLAVENEIHFMLLCPSYSDIRRNYIPSMFISKPPAVAFTNLLSSQNENVILNWSLCIKHSVKRRCKLLRNEIR